MSESAKKIDADAEIWKAVPGFETYEVSNHGNVRSNNYLGWGKIQSISLCDDGHGYLQCNLWKDGKQHCVKAHRLVAIAFIPNPDGKKEVNHKDGNKHNNVPSNLEWATREENLMHEHTTGLGDSAKEGLLRANVARRKPVIAIHVASGTVTEHISIQDAGRDLDVSATKICACLNGRRKSHKGYTFKYKQEE